MAKFCRECLCEMGEPRKTFCGDCKKNRDKAAGKRYQVAKNNAVKGRRFTERSSPNETEREKWLLANHYDLPRKSGNGYE